MYKPAIALCMAAFAPLASAQAQRAQTDQSTTKVDSETKNFVKNARIGGNFEGESSRLAAEESRDAALTTDARSRSGEAA